MNYKFNFPLDILIITIISILGFIYHNLLMGVLIIFFIPGYLVLSTLYPNPDQKDKYFNLILSIGFSAVISGILIGAHGFFLGGWISELTTLFIFSIIFSSLALIRRLPYLKSEDTGENQTPKKKLNVWGISKAISIFLMIISFAYFYTLSVKQTPEFTEFYILGEENLAGDYSTSASVAEPFSLKVGIVNNEGRDISYSIAAINNQEPVGLIHPIVVRDTESVEVEMIIELSRIGDNQQIVIVLTGEGLEFPHRSLTLWLDVNDPESN